MKIILAPDKFKGSLSSIDVSNAIKEGLLSNDPEAKVLIFPMADGGDGFAQVIKHYLSTRSIVINCVDPLGRKISSSYEWQDNSGTAIIELAQCSGLAILQDNERNPMQTSTYGTGLQIRHAIQNGARKIVLGLGGSATNDAGTGILSALGFMFMDGNGKELKPVGKNLGLIKSIIPPHVIPSVEFEIACDVNNPLFGPQGAAYIFSAQKGASSTEIMILDEGLKNFSSLIEQGGKKISSVKGTGAAGGIAAGLMAFFNVNIKSGIDLVIDASELKQQLPDADLIITGEGKLDDQTFGGKTINALVDLAIEYQKPVIAICGKLELSEKECKKSGITMVFSLQDLNISEEDSMKNAAYYITQLSKDMISRLKIHV